MEVNRLMKKTWFTSFVSCAVAGIGTHLFGLVNVLHNFDDIAVQPRGYGTGLKSGRWMLTFMGDFVKTHFGGHNLPYINGILFILLVSVSAAVISATLGLKKRRWAAFVGVIFAVFPSTTATLFYKYTVVYYGIAILLSVLAVFFLERYKFGLPLSVVCTALALGIYQAYVPITVTLFVILLIQKGIRGEKISKLVLKGLYACLSLVLGLGVYYLVLYICLKTNNMTLGTYQGVDDMGRIPVSDLPRLIRKAYSTFLKLPVKDYSALAQTRIIRLCYLFLGVSSVGITAYALATRVKKLIPSLFVVLMGGILPIAVNFIVIMCPNSLIYTLMVYSFALAPCFPVVLLDGLEPTEKKWQRVGETAVSRAVAAVLALLIVSYGYLANVNYTYLYYSNRQTENYMASIVTQVRMTEGFTADKTWAFIGDLKDPLLKGAWNNVGVYSGNASPQRLITAYSREKWLTTYCGYDVPLAKSDELACIAEDPRVKAMPCWPDNGSIAVIDDTIVIKFSD